MTHPSSNQPAESWKVLLAHPAGLAYHLSEGVWKPFKHLLIICAAIIAAINGSGPRYIIVTLPPRHGKSELISHWIPVWILENFPQWKIILASYEADFAASWGRKVRDTIQANADKLNVRVDTGSSAANRWNTATIKYGKSTPAGGGMITAGTGGPIVGRGANILIGDDFIKNAEEAASPTYRESLWKWFITTFMSRLEPNGIAILLITRWHEDDVVGRIEKMQDDPNYTGRRWHIIKMAAIAEDSDSTAHADPLNRKPGEALCPQRFDYAALMEIKGSMDDWAWQSLYQQNPKPPGGSIMQPDWWHPSNGTRYNAEILESTNSSAYYHNAIQGHKIIARFQSWDTGLKDTERSAYSVCLTFDLLANYKVALRDALREKLTFDVLPDTIVEQAQMWNQDRLLQQGTILIEDKSSGISAIQTLQASAPEWIKELIVPWQVTIDKESRAKAASVWCRRGRVLLPLQISVGAWLYLFEKEFFDFPGSTFKDQMDTFSQFISYIENYLEAGWSADTAPLMYEDIVRESEAVV